MERERKGRKGRFREGKQGVTGRKKAHRFGWAVKCRYSIELSEIGNQYSEVEKFKCLIKFRAPYLARRVKTASSPKVLTLSISHSICIVTSTIDGSELRASMFPM